MVTKTEEIVESKKLSITTKLIIIVGAMLLLTALYFLSGAATRAAEPVEPAILSRTAIGFFGYPGEETGVPTTLVLIRVDDYHRVLMASSGAEGETVTQAARFSLADGVMSLSVREINDDEYMDVVVGNLVLYGSDGGLSVW